jgi:hypothetical protein
MKHSRIVAAFAVAAVSTVLAPLAAQAHVAQAAHSEPSHRPKTIVNVRVEGLGSTLLPETTVVTRATTIDKDGKPADTCEGDTAAVALQDVTKGAWVAGTFSSGLGYPVIGILGVEYPFTSSYYWSFWINDKPATTGICGATLTKGEHLLFFPQCSSESASSCPGGTFDPAVLKLTGPKTARAGKKIVLSVASLANLTGKSSPASGVKLSAGGHTVTTGSSGKAKLAFAKAGTYKVVASAADSIRDELTVRVSG